jgi:L-amino acid N-acyltransferase YncA
MRTSGETAWSRDVAIVRMGDEHAAAVLRIYRLGIEEGNATFETEPPGWATFRAEKLPGHSYVAVAIGPDPAMGLGRPVIGQPVIGWVACGAVSKRSVYAGVVEHSVYVDPMARGRGVGRRLLAQLISSTEAAGIWTIQAGIFPENVASLELHRTAGFRTIGVRERVGRHHERWRDVVFIERRSKTV